jgi:hypothetical protein
VDTWTDMRARTKIVEYAPRELASVGGLALMTHTRLFANCFSASTSAIRLFWPQKVK